MRLFLGISFGGDPFFLGNYMWSMSFVPSFEMLSLLWIEISGFGTIFVTTLFQQPLLVSHKKEVQLLQQHLSRGRVMPSISFGVVGLRPRSWFSLDNYYKIKSLPKPTCLDEVIQRSLICLLVLFMVSLQIQLLTFLLLVSQPGSFSVQFSGAQGGRLLSIRILGCFFF